MKIPVVIIGLGNQALNEHIPALLRRSDIRIVGACDPSPYAIEQFNKLFPDLAKSIPTYANYLDAVEATLPRMAIVAVPHDAYFDIIQGLCQRHIYFLKEKPFARTTDEARKLLSIPGFTEYAFIAAQRRYGRLYQEAQRSIQKIGKPYLFTAIYKLNIESPHDGWRSNKERAGGGCLIDMGYHIVDQLLWWFGIPEKIHAQVSSLAIPKADYDAEDTATVSFQYANGLHGTLLISRAAGERREEYALYGNNGYIEGSKRHLAVHDKQGHLLNLNESGTAERMIDRQLDFFISRICGLKGFADIQAQHLKNMEFIERCYADALKINEGNMTNV